MYMRGFGSVLRLQKYLAECGVASRRGAEALIRDGRIKVNGKTIREMGVKIDEENDVVEFDEVRVKPQTKMVYIMLTY